LLDDLFDYCIPFLQFETDVAPATKSEKKNKIRKPIEQKKIVQRCSEEKTIRTCKCIEKIMNHEVFAFFLVTSYQEHLLYFM